MRIPELNRDQSIACIFLAIIIAIAGSYITLCPGPSDTIKVRQNPEENRGDERPSPKPRDAFVTVYVCGEVEAPGVYSLPMGSRKHNAIEAAGGITRNGSPGTINLAETLKNEDMISIPSARCPEISNSAAGSSKFEAASTSGLININDASSEALDRLPGIGLRNAGRIIEYRSQKGPFLKKEDLRNVPGLKAKTYEKVKDLITI